MRIYLSAASTSAHPIQEIAETLMGRGHGITCCWPWTAEFDRESPPKNMDPDQCRIYGMKHMGGVLRSELFIAFSSGCLATVDFRQVFELGMAVGLQKRIWFVGQVYHFCHCLPGIQHFASVDQAMTFLSMIDGTQAKLKPAAPSIN